MIEINDMDKKNTADLVVYGKVFTSESNKIVEAFAVKDGKYVYVGGRKGAEAFIEAGKTEVIDYTGKGLVMPSCGNGHAHYSIGVALPIVGTIAIGATPDQFLPVPQRARSRCRQEGKGNRGEVHLRLRLELLHLHGSYSYASTTGCHLQ